MDLSARDARLTLDDKTGLLKRLGLAGFHLPLLEGNAGLFDLALPLPDELPHRLRVTDRHQALDVSSIGPEWQLTYLSLSSPRGIHEVSCVLRLRPESDGSFAIRLQIVNHTPHVIPQVLFPNLSGLRATGPAKQEALHLGRAIKFPFASMQQPDGAASFYDLYRRSYFTYGMHEWPMKWFNFGNEHRGLSVFSKDLGAAVQGLYVEREKKARSLTIAWAHYPHIQTGETWISPEFLIQPHRGDWRAGAESYKAYAAPKLPTAKPTRYIRDSLGARSLYFSTYLYDNEPNFRYRDLPIVARDAREHGLKELVCWFLFDGYFELPMKLNPKLGTEAELKQAITECRQIGVNPVAFVSCRSIKTRTAPAAWFETDEHGNRRTQAWSYSLDFIPPFNPPYCNRDESAFVCPAQADYRKAFLAACADLQKLGFSSICFDQLFADRLCYASQHGHKPQDLLMPMYEMAKQALRDGQTIDPDATFSGEFFNDVSQTFQHYNWDWITGTNSLDELEPFRFVFPHFRLGILVDRGRRWLLEAFVRGLFINFLPDGGEGLIATDPDFSALARQLAEARQTYARFFEEGDYLGTRHSTGDPEIGGLYRHGEEWLLIVANVSERDIQLPSRSVVPIAMVTPAAMLPPFEFRIFHWRAGQEQWITV